MISFSSINKVRQSILDELPHQEGCWTLTESSTAPCNCDMKKAVKDVHQLAQMCKTLLQANHDNPKG